MKPSRPLHLVLDNVIDTIGRSSSWSIGLLVVVICLDVALRYLFNITAVWVTEIETYLFAWSIMMGISYALKHDEHVRVDLFYADRSPKTKARIDLFGAIFLLLPFSLVAIYVCHRFAWVSWRIGESSAQPGGLPALYLLKWVITAGFVLLLLQGISSILRSVDVLTGETEEASDNI